MRFLLARLFDVPPLTRTRVRLAYAIAIATDVLQLLLGPFGWAFIDEGLDVIAMLAISRVIGFHVVFLPTFVLEFLPGAGMLPTWTGAVALVVGLRRRSAVNRTPPGPVIDV